MQQALEKELSGFLESWSVDENKTKECFIRLKNSLKSQDDVQLSFVARPGITYSLRAAHVNQTNHGLFVMVDVIDDDPADRWLSVCFYKEMIHDPDRLADEVPEGLMGEDARCYDVYEYDEDMAQYIEARLTEAHQSAAME